MSDKWDSLCRLGRSTGKKRGVRGVCQYSILRIITNKFIPDPFVSNGLNLKIGAEALMSECFRTGKVCYSDNLTGTDFKQVIEQYNLRGMSV